MSDGTFFYPNVTQVPGAAGAGSESRAAGGEKTVKGEFDAALGQALRGPESTGKPAGLGSALGTVVAGQPGLTREPLKFSQHAVQRMRDRNIRLDSQTLSRVSDAVDKAEAKGVQDTLVLAGDAALIVSVKNRTVITAMDKSALQGNVFTNIDGAVIV